ncbi:4-fold beta flower protein [Bradyrhizobium sp. 145]|uniref:4-fold beta flower protein n=1 Tax=Bradyrhizobium sp. 145 TaxID=2782621 RepID=UPI001FF73663|nr:hypothetical protein [Bradyrhizobium sp. 145]
MFSEVTNYIYSTQGNAVGFIRGRDIHDIHDIHDMRGNAVGQLNGTHVHKLSGNYAGELDGDVVVDKHMGNFGNIGHPGNPGNAGSPGTAGSRGARGTGYRDVFHLLQNDVRSAGITPGSPDWLVADAYNRRSDVSSGGRSDRLLQQALAPRQNAHGRSALRRKSGSPPEYRARLARRSDGGEDQSKVQLKFAGVANLPRSTDD